MNENSYLPPAVLRLLSNLLLVVLVGSLDYVTGREVRLGTLYMLSVALASWNLKPRLLIGYLAFNVAVWTTVQRLTGVHYGHGLVFVWNVVNYGGVASITASMVSKTKLTLDRQQRLIRDLGQSLLKISQFKELVPVCRVCHELHFEEGYRAKLDELFEEGVDMESIGDICTGCLEARAARVAAIPVGAYLNSPLSPESAPRSAGSGDKAASPPRSAPPGAADGTPAP